MSNHLGPGNYTTAGPVHIVGVADDTGSVAITVLHPDSFESAPLIAPTGAVMGSTQNGQLAIIPQGIDDGGQGGGEVVPERRTIEVPCLDSDFSVDRHNAAVLSGDPEHDEKWPGSADAAAHEAVQTGKLVHSIRYDSTGDASAPADYFVEFAFLQFALPAGVTKLIGAKLVCDVVSVVDDVAQLEQAQGKPVVGGGCEFRISWVDNSLPWPARVPWRRDVPIIAEAGAWPLRSLTGRAPFAADEFPLAEPPDGMIQDGVVALVLYIEGSVTPPLARNQVHIASSRFPSTRAIRPRLVLDAEVAA